MNLVIPAEAHCCPGKIAVAPRRHPGEGRDPGKARCARVILVWTPASAGVTIVESALSEHMCLGMSLQLYRTTCSFPGQHCASSGMSAYFLIDCYSPLECEGLINPVYFAVTGHICFMESTPALMNSVSTASSMSASLLT